MADAVEDVKARLGIYDVVSQYVQLKKAGVNWKGLCPFHSEKTPSFVVSPEKQICHCFGCNKGGDIFTFVQELEGIAFPEALQILADRAGVSVDTEKLWKKEKKSEKDEYYKAHELACDFFENQLYKTMDGEKVLDYLYRRGLNDCTIKEFRIGFAPESYDALYTILLKKGISKTVLIKSGLASAKNIASDSIYDKYRSRLIFPIFDYYGRICGFGGRALQKDQMPKYLNSPENAIYNKSKVLFGLSHAKKFIKERDKAVFVEGYFDVIVPYQEGVKNVVATSGTALTSDQVRLMKRFTSNVVSSFDSDNAGFEATKRAYELFSEQGLFMKTIAAQDDKDPADFVRDKGGEAFSKLVDTALDFIDVYILKLIQDNDVSTLDGRRGILRTLMPYFKLMQPSIKDHYVRELSKKLNISERHLYDEIDSFALPSSHPARGAFEGTTRDDQSVTAKMPLESIILAIILGHPDLFAEIKEKVDEKTDFESDNKAIYKILNDQYNSSRTRGNAWDIGKAFSSDLSEKVDVLMLYCEDKYSRISQEALLLELEKLIAKLRKMRVEKQLRDIQKQMSEAEESNDKDKLLELLTRQKELLSHSKEYGQNK